MENKHLLRVYIYVFLDIVSLCLQYSEVNLHLLGIILVYVSLDSLLALRQKESLFMLLGIMAITNISIAYSCCWFYSENAIGWQIGLDGSLKSFVTAKALTVFFITFIISLMITVKNRMKFSFSISFVHNSKWRCTPLVFWGMYLFLYYILFFCFNRSVNEYTTGSSALYEYAIIIYLMLWICMPTKRIYKVLMLFYAFCYIIQGLLFGDRSSALPLILVLYFLLRKTYKPVQFILLSLFGVMGANLMGIYRRTFTFGSEIMSEVFNRLLYVDSIAYSYYSGVQIVSASSVIHGKFEHFCGWCISLFLGKSNKYDLAGLVENYGGFHNTGGGMTSTYFYFWADMIGVLFGALLMGWLIGKSFSKGKTFYPFVQISILAFALRWYSYFPNVFFRTCIIIPIVLYFLTSFVGKHSKTKRI